MSTSGVEPSAGPGAMPGWWPPVRQWGPLMSQPTCTLTVNASGPEVIATIAEELRSRRQRVKVTRDGRSVRAKNRWPLIAIVIGIVTTVGADPFSTSVMTATVTADDASGATVTVVVRSGGLGGMRTPVTDALNATAWRLAQQGVVLTVTPWERYTRFRRNG